MLTGLVVESAILGLSVLPAALFWRWSFDWNLTLTWLRVVVLSMSLVPAYLLFAVALMLLSAGAMRLLGWRTPADAELVIADMGWPLLRWVRYAASIHVTRVFAGTFLQATPLWTFYLRLNGARMGRGVYVNSGTLSDHNLLEFGDGVVIGAGVHLAGHMVEGGVVKTGRVRLGRNVTIGVGAVVGIGVAVGDNTEVGALSMVPKHSALVADAIYGGVPVRRLDRETRG